MSRIKIYALGGLGEDGKNMYCIDVDDPEVKNIEDLINIICYIDPVEKKHYDNLIFVKTVFTRA